MNNIKDNSIMTDSLDKKGIQPTEKTLLCFIIMPFKTVKFENPDGTIVTLDEDQLTTIYNDLFKKGVESYDHNNVRFTAHRSKEKTGNFVKSIISHLDTAYLVMADLTGLNPNVFYELGIRHTLKTKTILLTQNKKELPSDLASYIAFEYKYPQKTHEFASYYPVFEKELHDTIDQIIKDPNKSDNPVRDFIGDRVIFRNEQRIKEIKGNISLLKIVEKEYINNVLALGQRIEDWKSGRSKNLTFLQNTAKPLLQRLIMLNESEYIINFIQKHLIDIQIIESNMGIYMNRIKNMNGSRVQEKIPFGFSDISGKYHDLTELYEYYTKDKNNIREIPPCPIRKSIAEMIRVWEKELEQLNK